MWCGGYVVGLCSCCDLDGMRCIANPVVYSVIVGPQSNVLNCVSMSYSGYTEGSRDVSPVLPRMLRMNMWDQGLFLCHRKVLIVLGGDNPVFLYSP